MANTTVRDLIRRITPRWLKNYFGERILYSLTLPADAIGDASIAAVKIRFPGVHSPESLPQLGKDRRIARGRNESDATYAARLNRWLDDHSTRGGPYALLTQIHAHYAPNNFPLQLVYRSGKRFLMDTAGVITQDTVTWDFDLEPEKWARWTLFYEWSTPISGDGIWSDLGTYDDGGVWDSDLTVLEVADIRLVPTQWNAAHCDGKVFLLTDDHELWDYPTGTWGDAGDWEDYPPASLCLS